MVRSALKRTLILNVGGFADQQRYETASLIKNSFDSYRIQSIQFMPNHVTFEYQADKMTLARNE